MKPAADVTTDVLVVGLGAAGHATALAAAEEGVDVLVAEQQSAADHHPTLRLSGGYIMTVDDVDAGAAYLDACAGGLVPEPVSRAWADGATTIDAWVTSFGLRTRRVDGAEFGEFPGAEHVAIQRVQAPDWAATGGDALYHRLRRACDDRGVRVAWESRVCGLVRDASGRVAGALLERVDGAITRVHARRGVVLTAGGFGGDPTMQREHLSVQPTFFYGNPGNRGDGVRLAQSAGAGLWHMNRMSGRGVISVEVDGQQRTYMPRFDPTVGGNLIVDRVGRRFANEELQVAQGHSFYYELAYYSAAERRHARVPAAWVLDRARLMEGPLVFVDRGMPALARHPWSDDNRAELAAGWIVEASTPEGLAEALGLEDPMAFAGTLEAYRAACAAQTDDLGRSAATLHPLEGPPYYGVLLWPGGSHTFGGPMRDAAARVLDPYGEHIPGLYAAGELGAPIGMLYPAAGAALCEAFCFGRWAGRHAARAAVT